MSVATWQTYTDTKNGFTMMYPTGLTVQDASTGYPERIEFKPDSIKLGSFFTLTIFDTVQAKTYGAPITSIQSIPQTNYNSETPTTISNIMVGAIPVQLTKQGEERATVSFIHGQNAYRLDWSCWSMQACFNDEILNKLVNSISFAK